jgi:hypothetical protein
MFFVSVLIVILSSYLILSGLKSNNNKEKGQTGFLYFLLIAFSQLVLSFEVLSLFKSISKSGVLICNIVFFILSVIFFFIRGRKLYCNFDEIKIIKFALKRDKALKFLGICFLFFLIFQLITIFLFGLETDDALNYYFTRCTEWIQNKSISHFLTTDTRELIMPVNMDFLYTWLLIFRKSEMGAAIFSFIGYTGVIYVIYNLLKELNFSVRRRLWAIFVFSSFALVMVEMTRPCADLFVGGLILSSIYLFIKSSKDEDRTALYFSALSYALAIGTKTTSIIAIPSVFIILCTLTYIYKKESFIKNLSYFCGLFILNFIIFSSYNYILNFIQFSNPFSCREQLLLNQFRDGCKGYIANVIKYTFTIFDMSGMPSCLNINKFIENIQNAVLSLFGLTLKTGTTPYFPYYFSFNNKIGLLDSSLGIMGLLSFMPSIIYSFKRLLKNKYNKTVLIIAFMALSLIINILIYSRTMVFTGYNLRYILTFVVIASPVVVYSYPAIGHKYWKILLCGIMFIYLIGYAHHKPFSLIITSIKQNKLANTFIKTEESNVYNFFIKKSPDKIIIMTGNTDSSPFYIEKLRLNGFYMEKLLVENIEVYNLNDFNYIITTKSYTESTNIVNFKDRIQNPQKYIAKCLYSNKVPEPIFKYEETNEPAVVECDIPFAYLKQNGFNYLIHQNNKYIVLGKNKTPL